MMVFRVVASGLVLFAAGSLARRAGHPYRERVRTLEQWQRLLRHLLPLIQWKRVPLADALEDSVRGQDLLYQPMRRFVQTLSNRDIEFQAAWDAMLLDMPGLWEEDRGVLRDFGRALGKSDVAFQHDQVDAAAAELQRLSDEARRQRAQDGRLVPAMVSALGVLVVILML